MCSGGSLGGSGLWRVWRAPTALLCAVIVLAGARPIPAGTGTPAPPTSQAVQAAIDRGVKFLYSRHDPQGFFPNPHSVQYVGGGEALVVLALLRAGESPENPKIKATLQFLKTIQPGHTYTHALRAMVYARLGGEDYRRRLNADAQWLIKYQRTNGGWGYGPRSRMAKFRPKWTDASNTEMALLALQEAADAGIDIPSQCLWRAEAFWRSFRNADGGWGYQPKVDRQEARRPGSHGSMTAAALASYFLFADRLGPDTEDAYDPDRSRRPGSLAFADRIRPALDWLGKHFEVDKVPQYKWVAQPSQLHYYLYLLQRAADAAGARTFGKGDCSVLIATSLLAAQRPDGSWKHDPQEAERTGRAVIDTAFALLALLDARAPVVLTRLRLADPGRDSRDAANLTRWLARQVGRKLAWRQVGPKGPAALDGAGLVYVNPPRGADLPQPMHKQLTEHLRGGGFCLIHMRDAKSARRMGEAFKGLFPHGPPRTLPDDHPAFSLRFAVDKAHRPEIIGLGDGARTQLFILAKDISGAWHQSRHAEYPYLFALGGNLVLYAAGGKIPAGKFPDRPAGPAPKPRARIPIARLKYAGDFDTFAGAAGRLSDRLARSLTIGLSDRGPVDASGPIDAGIKVLWLTGNIPPKLSEGEKGHVRDYLGAGGTLLIDPAIGRKDFRDAALAAMKDICGADNVRRLKADHPLVTGAFGGGAGADLRRLRLVGAPAGKPAPADLWAGSINGRIAAVLSVHGLTCSLDGSPCVGNAGYVAADAEKVAGNVILHAVVGQK